MKSAIQNASAIYDAVKSCVKTSFININFKSKWYNHGENLSIELAVGCVRSSKKPTKFTDVEYNNLISTLEYNIGSYEISKKDRKTLTDRKSGQEFEVVIVIFKPISY